MAKKKLANEMTDITVDQLRAKHRELIATRMRCPGDSEGAMYSLQREFGLDYWPQWNFLFKRERTPPPRFIQKLREVILLAASQSVRKEMAKLEIEAAEGNVAPDLESLRAEAQALLAKIEAAAVRK